MSRQSIFVRIWRDQSGASALEYGLLIAGLSIVIISALQGMSLGFGAIWSTVTNNTNAAVGTSSSSTGGSSG